MAVMWRIQFSSGQHQLLIWGGMMDQSCEPTLTSLKFKQEKGKCENLSNFLCSTHTAELGNLIYTKIVYNSL